MARFQEIYSPIANVFVLGRDDKISNFPSKANKFESEFEVIQKIGEGCFGEAFKVRSRLDGKFYAIKKTKTKYQGMGDRNRKLEEVKKAMKISNQKHSPSKVKTSSEDIDLQVSFGLDNSLRATASASTKLGRSRATSTSAPNSAPEATSTTTSVSSLSRRRP